MAVSIFGLVFQFIAQQNTGSTKVFRILRVLRAFRTLRLLGALKTLQVVVNTFLQSLVELMNIVLLTFIVMFIFAVVGVQMFGQIAPQHFGSLPFNLYTLWVCITQDGWAKIFIDVEERTGALQNNKHSPNVPFLHRSTATYRNPDAWRKSFSDT